jgi:heme-degrading monooxygenase HmoA
MISRIWHGWTTPANADAYETLLRSEIFPWIEERQISGFQGIQLLRRESDESVEFVTIMWFDSMESVREFAGDDPEVAVVLPPAQALLAHYDARSQHYEVRIDAQGSQEGKVDA